MIQRTEREGSTTFPFWVAIGSLAIAGWLYAAAALPAVQERRQLRQRHEQLTELRAQADQAITEVRLGRSPGETWDLQSLFVAIDQHGYTPAELAAAYPEAAVAGLATPPRKPPARDVAKAAPNRAKNR